MRTNENDPYEWLYQITNWTAEGLTARRRWSCTGLPICICSTRKCSRLVENAKDQQPKIKRNISHLFSFRHSGEVAILVLCRTSNMNFSILFIFRSFPFHQFHQVYCFIVQCCCPVPDYRHGHWLANRPNMLQLYRIMWTVRPNYRIPIYWNVCVNVRWMHYCRRQYVNQNSAMRLARVSMVSL